MSISRGESFQSLDFLRDSGTNVRLSSLNVTNGADLLLNVTPVETEGVELSSSGLLRFIQDPENSKRLIVQLSSYNGESSELTFNFKFTFNSHTPPSVLALVHSNSESAVENIRKEIQSGSDIVYEHPHIEIVDTYPVINDETDFEWTFHYHPKSQILMAGEIGWKESFSLMDLNIGAHTANYEISFDVWIMQSLIYSSPEKKKSPGFSEYPISAGTEPINFEALHSTISRKNSTTLRHKHSPSCSPSSKLTSNQASPTRPMSEGKNPAESFNLDIVDSPLLRYKIQQSEKSISNLKIEVKRLIKAVAEYEEAGRMEINASRKLIDTVKKSRCLDSVNYLLENWLNSILRFREAVYDRLETLVRNPMEKLYEKEIKSADIKTKEFLKEAEEFYHFEAKHLALKHEKYKNGPSLDIQYEKRKEKFGQKILDIYLFLHELTEGPKEGELMMYFLSFIQKYLGYAKEIYQSIEENKYELAYVEHIVSSICKVTNDQRKSIQERRRQSEKRINANSSNAYKKNYKSNSFPSAKDQLNTRVGGVRDLGSFDIEQASSAGRHKEGVLYSPARRRPSNLDSSWHGNWCVISRGHFSEIVNWKKKPEARKASISLKLASVRQLPNAERRFCFELVTLTGKRVYQALSHEDMIDWINVLKNAIESQLNGMSSSSDLRTMATIDKKGKIKESEGKESLRTVLKYDPSNEQCADCGSKNPEWCSINFGVLLCIECSGIHRSLGTHVSKIRSLTLDKSFSPDLIEMISRIGNSVFNEVWEARVTSSADGLPRWSKPCNTDSREVKASFIKAKYIDRTFVQPLSTQEIHKSPKSLMFGAIESNDLVGVMRAFALGANLNEPIGECGIDLDEKIDAGITPLQFAFLLHSDVFSQISRASTVTSKRSINFIGEHQYAQSSPEITGHLRRRTIQILPSHKTPSLSSSSCSVLDCSETDSMTSISEAPNQTITFPIPEFLIQNGADVNARSSRDGVTALSLVASKGNISAVKYLLGKGADANIDGVELHPSTLATKLSIKPREVSDSSVRTSNRALKSRSSSPCMRSSSLRLPTSKVDRLSVARLFK